MVKFFLAFTASVLLLIKMSNAFVLPLTDRDNFNNCLVDNQLEQDTKLEVIRPDLNFNHKIFTIVPLINYVIPTDIYFESDFRPEVITPPPTA